MAKIERWKSTPFRPASNASIKATRKMLLEAGHPMFVKQAKAQRDKRVQQGKDVGFYALLGVAALGALYLAHKAKTPV